jgi:predicted phage-related endonuclease
MVGKLTRDDQLSCSLLPALLGLSPYDTPNDLLLRIGAVRQGKQPEPWKPNEAAAWGNRLEEEILDEAALRLDLTGWGAQSVAHPHATLPLGFSPDGFGFADEGAIIRTDPSKGIYVVGQDELVVSGMGVLEAKLTSERAGDSPPLHRGPIQLMGGMMCTAAKWGAVAVLHQGIEMRIWVFAAHAGTQQKIWDAVLDFERRLKDPANPEFYDVASSDEATRIWSRTFDDAEPPVDLPEECGEFVQAWLDAKRAIAAAEAIKDDAERVIKTAMGNHAAGRINGYEVKWPMRKFEAQPEKITPAKAAYEARQNTLAIKEIR